MRPAQIFEATKFMLRDQHVHRIVPFIWGPPGAGKSDVIRQAATALDMNLIDIRLSEHDASEIKGIDMPDTETKCLVRYLPEYIQRIKTSNKPTVLFFDEANSGHASTQPPLYKITNDRTVGDYQLPDNVSIVLAGNRETDRSITTKMSAALGNRLAHLQFEVNVDDLCAWAIDNNVNHEFLAFWRFRPELVHKFDPNNKSWPSPRSWSRVDKTLHSNLTKETEYELISGIIGEGATAEFMAFLGVYRDLPTIDEILIKPADARVPSSLSTQFALTTALGAKATVDNIQRLMEYIKRLPLEFQVVFVRDATGRKSGIESTKSFIQWATQNADVLAV